MIVTVVCLSPLQVCCRHDVVPLPRVAPQRYGRSASSEHPRDPCRPRGPCSAATPKLSLSLSLSLSSAAITAQPQPLSLTSLTTLPTLISFLPSPCPRHASPPGAARGSASQPRGRAGSPPQPLWHLTPTTLALALRRILRSPGPEPSPSYHPRYTLATR